MTLLFPQNQNGLKKYESGSPKVHICISKIYFEIQITVSNKKSFIVLTTKINPNSGGHVCFQTIME